MILTTDFTVGLGNKTITEKEVKNWMKKLDKFSAFSFIVPEKYIRHIRVPFNTRSLAEEAVEYPWYKDSVMVFTPK